MIYRKSLYTVLLRIKDIYTQICSEWGFEDRYTLTQYYLAAAREKKRRIDLNTQAEELKKKLEANFKPTQNEISIMNSTDIHQLIQQIADLEKSFLLELKKRNELTKEEKQRLPSHLR